MKGSCPEVLEESVVEKGWRRGLERSVGEECCGVVLENSVVEKSAGTKLWRRVLDQSVVEKCCRVVLEKRVAGKCWRRLL